MTRRRRLEREQGYLSITKYPDWMAPLSCLSSFWLMRSFELHIVSWIFSRLCMQLGISAYTSICPYTFICKNTFVYTIHNYTLHHTTCKHAGTHRRIQTDAHKHKHTYARTYAYTHLHIGATHKHTHTYIYIYICVCVCVCVRCEYYIYIYV